MDDGSYLPSTETHTGTGSRVTLAKEPYTCERLCNIRGGYQQLTSAVIALKFDFLDPEVCLYVNVCTPVKPKLVIVSSHRSPCHLMSCLFLSLAQVR